MKKTLTFCFLGSTLTSFSAASTVVFTFLFLTKTRTSGTETSLGPDIHEQSIKRVSLKTKKDSSLIRSTEIRTFGEFKVLVLSDLGLCLKWKSLFWIGGIWRRILCLAFSYIWRWARMSFVMNKELWWQPQTF
jgi:hypothetical protein